jgi:hypothetical protein
MKIILAGLIALAALASVAGSVAAGDARTFFDQQDRARFLAARHGNWDTRDSGLRVPF